MKNSSIQSNRDKVEQNHQDLRKALAKQLKKISTEEYNEIKKLAREKAALRKAEVD